MQSETERIVVKVNDAREEPRGEKIERFVAGDWGSSR